MPVFRFCLINNTNLTTPRAGDKCLRSIMLSRYRDRDRDFPGFTDPDQSRDPEIYRDRD